MSRSQRIVLVLILTGQLMAVLDASIVNVAIPTIRLDLHASGADLQLIVAGYVIAYAVLLITGARLGSRYGFRTAFLWGLGIFTAGSLACGLAPTSGTLIVLRALQGMGAALMVPQVFSLIQRTFFGPARAQALSLWAAILALGGIVGQVLGGLLVTADLFGTGWRPVFLVNVPIGAVLLVASQRWLPIDQPETARPLDIMGLVILSGAVLLLVVPLVLGHDAGWPTWTIALIAASGVALAAFAWIERGIERRGGAPLIAERVVRAPGLAFALIAILLATASNGGFLFSFTQHLQLGLGDTAFVAGLTFVPLAIASALASLTWQRVPPRWRNLIVPLGCAVAAFGYGLTGLSVADGSTGGLLLPVGLVILGTGQGMIAGPILVVGLSRVDPQNAADASGVLATVIQLGLVLGVATFGSVYLTQAAVPGPHSSAAAVTATLGLMVIALIGCAAASVAMVRAQRTPMTAWAPPTSTNAPAQGRDRTPLN
jgi:MFS family permease